MAIAASSQLQSSYILDELGGLEMFKDRWCFIIVQILMRERAVSCLNFLFAKTEI